MRTHIINVIGAITRITVGVDNVRKLWNIKEKYGENKTELEFWNNFLDRWRQKSLDSGKPIL